MLQKSNKQNLYAFMAILVMIFQPTVVLVMAQGTVPSVAELWEIIQKQQQEIEALKEKLNMVEEEVVTATEMVEQVAEMPFNDKGLSWADKTSVGGYGELHYNNLTDQSRASSDRRQVDFHRFVLYFGHEFTDRIRLFSEFELEHALTSGDDNSPGEVELEQAYVDIDIVQDEERSLTLRSGLFLIPVGILNETHEPPTFYGVERNKVESEIIPSTWWEAGLSLYGDLIPGLRYDLAFTSGLAVPSHYYIRGGRQKVGKAAASDPAYTARLKWVRPGLELAATFHYQTDLTQNKSNGAAERSEATLFETHAVLEKGPFGLRALYARWDLDADAADRQDGGGKPDQRDTDGDGINDVGGAKQQHGWFIEPSLKLNEYFGVFFRFSEWDRGASDSTNSRFQQFDLGLNWWPHENVVLKFDYQDQQSPDGEIEHDGFNLGFGYQF